MAKRKARPRRRRLVPITEAIRKDAANKKALHAEFKRFYRLTKKLIRSKQAPQELAVPLERLKVAVSFPAFGPIPIGVLVEVEDSYEK